jgi:peptide/nickel transport system ATP-binding protein
MNALPHDHVATNESLLDIESLSVSFGSLSNEVRVVDNVSFSIPRGKTVALVGESGCGKSVTALSILRLIPSPSGEVVGGRIILGDWASAQAKACGSGGRRDTGSGVDLLKLSEDEIRRVRGNRIAMVFQEPMTSLNPVLSVGEQIVEVLELHRGLKGKKAWSEATELLRKVGIADPVRRVRAYPHEMSGGMRQRVMIAMALACQPDLLIADEPTTALDVTVQRQILDLLASLQQETGMSVLLITHDLGVVAGHADYVYVMYAGQIVEHAPVAELFENPLHPYTQGLLRCSTSASEKTDRLHVVPGQVPNPANMPPGCRFHPRCALTQERAEGAKRNTTRLGSLEKVVLRRCVEMCENEESGQPRLTQVSLDQFVACWERQTQ